MPAMAQGAPAGSARARTSHTHVSGLLKEGTTHTHTLSLSHTHTHNKHSSTQPSRRCRRMGGSACAARAAARGTRRKSLTGKSLSPSLPVSIPHSPSLPLPLSLSPSLSFTPSLSPPSLTDGPSAGASVASVAASLVLINRHELHSHSTKHASDKKQASLDRHTQHAPPARCGMADEGRLGDRGLSARGRARVFLNSSMPY
jgi:hypothetical protein